jgi:tetratricopeptide (TPR) repeat protein
MTQPNLKRLKQLLDSPDELKNQIDEIRNLTNIEESVKGFVALYDQMNGNVDSIKIELKKNKALILTPLNNEKRKVNRRKYFLYAASLVVLILGSMTLLFFQYDSNSPLFSDRYNDPGVPNYMNANNRNSIGKVMFLYKTGDFENAKTTIIELRKKENNDTLIYYSAILDYKLKKYNSAIKTFEYFINSKGTYKVKSLYFSGICYAEQKLYQESTNSFNLVILSDQEPFASLAKKHLEEIEENRR